MVSADSAIFKPLKVGTMELQTRIAMAPLTRFRANERHAHEDIGVEYYAQRACHPGTLLITEATFIDQKAGLYAHAPGIYTEEQIQGWKKVVDAVHAKGSYIYLQLWALGRAADPGASKKEDSAFEVVSASDIAFEGGAKPRALTKQEIQDYVSYYARAAKAFVEEAGGDGVEIHGANGYLLDQFLQTTSNQRTDEYGGSLENRARFPLDVVRAVSEAVGEERTAIRLSPYSSFQGMKMSDIHDIKETFSYVVEKIVQNHPKLAYVHAVESRIAGNATIEADEAENLEFLRDIWAPRPFFIAGGFNDHHGPELADKHENNVIVYGRYFISNPDLVYRLKKNIPLTEYDRDTFYLQGPSHPEGYTNYPFASEEHK
ncbi:hypothetical protein JCM11641_002248 [Rhodosporidiobolus odoratus]